MAWYDFITGGWEAIKEKTVEIAEKVGEVAEHIGRKIQETGEGILTGDIFFDDNPKRQSRAEELATDCGDFAGRLAEKTKEIDGQLRDINTKIANAFKGAIERPGNPFRLQDLEVEGQRYVFNEALMPLVTRDAALPALMLGVITLTVRSGGMPGAVLTAALGVTGLYSISQILQSGPGGIAIVIGLGAVTGAERRSELQSAIHRGISARQKLAHAFVVNGKLVDGLRSIAMEIQLLVDAGRTEEEVVAKVKEQVAEQRVDIQRRSDPETATRLASLDRAHNSWTKEDD